MIKFFKNEDILVTAFSVAAPQVVNNVVTDLIAGNDSDDDYFPILLLLYINHKKKYSNLSSKDVNW